MKSSCSGPRTSFFRHCAAGLSLWALFSGSSCGGPPKQVAQPVPRETEVAHRLVEEFDPRSVRVDLLLIEPAFPPPFRTAAPAAESPVQDRSPDKTSVGKPAGSSAAERQGAYRVQVVALSSETGARELAESLQRQLEVEATAISHNGLHAVRAGRFTHPGSAEALRARIAGMRSDFADAFVVREDAPAEVETSTPTNPSPGMEAERDLPEAADAGGVRAPGWRVLIDQFLELTDAEEFRRRAVERLDREDVEINFQQPWYKVEVGQFRTGEEAAAQELVGVVKRRGFPNALKVRGEVTVPEEDQ